MSERRPSSSVRFRYGRCLNDECSKCKSKELQEISIRKEFVCEECGKELRECRPPKKKNPVPLIILAVVLVAISAGAFFFSVNSGEDKSEVLTEIIDSTVIEPVDTIVSPILSDTISQVGSEVKQKNKSEKASEQEVSSSTTIKLSYGTYSGQQKKGYPHGQGRLTYTKERRIHKSDMKSRTANPGDYVIGEFHNGFVVYGKLYDKSGNLLSSLNFGVGSDDVFDDK